MVDMYSGPSTDRSSQNDGLENDLECFLTSTLKVSLQLCIFLSSYIDRADNSKSQFCLTCKVLQGVGKISQAAGTTSAAQAVAS